MNLKLILGASKTDKKALLMDNLRAKMQQYPQDHFIWLVPNHIKFESEVEILANLDDQETVFATNQVQVFSFSRLAWFFLRNDPLYQKPQLTPTTQVMLLSHILQQLEPQLQLYKGEVQRIGFVKMLQTQIDVLNKSQILPERLRAMNEELKAVNGDLRAKLHDLTLIYEQYESFVSANYSDDLQLFALLNNFLQHDSRQQHFHYFISDFSQFNMQERQLLQTILTTAADVEISVTIDRAYSAGQENSFFHRSQSLITDLTTFAKQHDIPVVTQLAQNLRVTSDLAALDDFWIAQNTQLKDKKTHHLNDASAIQVWNARTSQQEVIAVTTYIRQLVATQGYRYRDFLVLVPNLADYQQFLDPYFQIQEISYFVDQHYSMKDHPFKDLVDNLFAIVQNDLAYNNVFRLLRTELLIFADWTVGQYRQAVDLTENYVLAHGISAKQWLQTADFAVNEQHTKDAVYVQQMAQINRIKKLVMQLYQAMHKILQTASTVKMACSLLYELLDEFLVFSNLKQWEQQAIAAGNLVLGQQPEQVVNMFSQILDEYVDLFGEQQFGAETFLTVLDSGFENAYYLNIPSVLDAVHVSQLDQEQTNNRLVTIIMGSDDQNMPRLSDVQNLLSDDDVKALKPLLNADESLPETQQQLNNSAPFLHDLAFLSGTKRLIFTYAKTRDSKVMNLSPYVSLIEQHFALREQMLDFTAPVEFDEVLKLVGSPLLTADHLLAVYRAYKDQKQAVPKAWQALSDILFENQQAENIYLSRIWQGLSYQNIAKPLLKDIAAELYGSKLTVSISQLETFYRNPYEYFLRYGLGLRPRAEFKITPASQGTLFHDIFDRTVKQLQLEHLSWQTISAQQLATISDKLMQQLLSEKIYRVFAEGDPFQRWQIRQMAQRSLEVLRLQAQKAAFYPFQTEVAFGQVGALHNIAPLNYKLDDKHEIVVRGRIDRIDLLQNDPNYYFVVDYKSSKHDFKFTDFYYGLNMQMITYLASLENDPSLFDQLVSPVGGFYFQLQNPIINLEELKGQTDTAFDLLFKKYQYKGLLIDDGNSTQALEPDIDKQASVIFQINKNHKINSQKLVTMGQFAQLLQFNEHLIKQAAKAIFAGENQIKPLRLSNQQTTLQYSDFLPIMQFDAMLPENNYLLPEKLKKKDFFTKITGDAEDE